MSDKRKKAAKAAKLAKDEMACNKPRRTPGHKTKSHVVKACEGGEEKIVRFGQQGVSGAGSNPRSKAAKARRAAFKARHAKNIKKGKIGVEPNLWKGLQEYAAKYDPKAEVFPIEWA